MATLGLVLLAVLPGCSSKDAAAKDVDVPKQISDLKSPDANTRIEAAVKLGSVGPKALPAVPALIELLKDQDSEVRRLAAYALGQIGPKASQAIAPLKELLKDESREVYTQVVNSLRSIDPKAPAGPTANIMSP